MLSFEFSEEQREIQRSVREFSQREIFPKLRKMDEEKRIPSTVLKGMAEMGLLGMTVSNEYGGTGADPVTVGIVAEELARGDISCAIPTLFLVQAAWGYILDRYGSRETKERILPSVTRGKAFLGIAATEPDAGSDLANIRTVARRDGRIYRVNGEKTFISGVDEASKYFDEGGGFVTVVKTDPSRGTRGMSLLYIPAKGKKGVTPSHLEEWGRRGISAGGFSMEEVEVPEGDRIGEENRGFYLLLEGFDYARAIISVVCAGAGQRSLELSTEQLKLRNIFGQPLARYEGVQFGLAEHWAKLDAVKLLGYKALWMKGGEQSGKPVGRFDVTKISAEAKMLAPRFAFEAINDAIQWFGAFGYTVECPLELALKGVRSYFWAEGALEIMKVIVARELLGKEFAATR